MYTHTQNCNGCLSYSEQISGIFFALFKLACHSPPSSQKCNPKKINNQPLLNTESDTGEWGFSSYN